MTTPLSTATPNKLYLMKVATIGGANVPVPCYLVELSDKRHILIDSGIPEELPPEGPVLENKRNVLEQLAMIGLRPEDISIVVCTHFDFDHTAFHCHFPHAEFIVQRSQFETKRTRVPAYDSVREWEHDHIHYRLLDGDTELFPGFSLLETSGHTIGHQSVLMRLPETGFVMLTADAVLGQSDFVLNRPSNTADEDSDRALASTHKLIQIAQQIKTSLVVFGHDSEQWRLLRKLPEFYS